MPSAFFARWRLRLRRADTSQAVSRRILVAQQTPLGAEGNQRASFDPGRCGGQRRESFSPSHFQASASQRLRSANGADE